MEPWPITLPPARGPLSQWFLDETRNDNGPRAHTPPPAVQSGSGFSDDLQLALYLCYELHYGGLAGIDDRHEWSPKILEFRARLEDTFESALHDQVGPCDWAGDVRVAIPRIIAHDSGPSLSTYMEHEGTLDEMVEIVKHRSAYQLKEGDPHTFAIPRIHGEAKRLLVEIQAGEYGADEPGHAMHSTLFAETMTALGLDPRPNAYLAELPATALAVSNLISLFGLHRRLRGALVGHLAVFELTSVIPMGRYSRALARMGAPLAARRFYEVHVLADAAHETMALDMASRLAAAEPDLQSDIVFGARAVLEVECRFAATLLTQARTPRVVATEAA